VATDVACRGKRGRVTNIVVAVARQEGRRCRFLRAQGTLSARSSCRALAFVGARGGSRWRAARHARLRPGRYLVWSRARDAAGNTELPGRRNAVAFVVH
jgi:hypothetical protein